MNLKPQDVLVLLKLVTKGSEKWSYASLAAELHMSPAEVHAGVMRAVDAKLVNSQDRTVIKSNLEEFLIHGVKYSFPPEIGGQTRGVPTGFAAPPLKDMIAAEDSDPPVWPDSEGKVRGYEFSPLYRSVAMAVREDSVLYELAALVDAIRGGKARERQLAVRELRKRISGHGKSRRKKSR